MQAPPIPALCFCTIFFGIFGIFIPNPYYQDWQAESILTSRPALFPELFQLFSRTSDKYTVLLCLHRFSYPTLVCCVACMVCVWQSTDSNSGM